MLSRWVRTWYSRLLQPFLLLLAGFGVTPTMLTISSLLLILVSGFVLSQNHLIIGGIFLLLGSLVRSRAGMVGIETKDVGLVTRFERILILLIGLFTHRITVALWILAVLNNLAVLQRVIYVLRVSLLQKRESVVE